VPQSIYLTDNTILENIGFGVAEDDIDVGRVKTVVKSANLGNFIESLDHGLETYVGERGVQISGGQKQRIGIARALYSDPEILIFDEATSALDGNSEKTILQSINTVLHKKTIIMIAHRLNTVKNCDTIYVMDKGKIVASGSYNDLMESSEIFQGMVRNA
jgi:HlyD family secretion protein